MSRTHFVILTSTLRCQIHSQIKIITSDGIKLIFILTRIDDLYNIQDDD